jgi:putative spermidine/putrescine transport system permease protein
MARTLLWALGVTICAFLVAPAFVVVPLSLSSSPFLQFPPPGYTLHWYGTFFASESWTGALVRSAVLAFLTTGLSVVIGTAATYGLVRRRQRLTGVIRPLLVLPLMVPGIIFAAGLYIMALRLGLLGLGTLLIAHVVLALPFVILNVEAGLRTTDFRLELAAQTLGASRLQAFLRVTLPLMLPAVLAGAVFAGLTSLDETVVALFLAPDAEPTLPVRMYSSIRFELDPLVPVAATIMLAGSIFIGGTTAGLYRLVSRRSMLRPGLAVSYASSAEGLIEAKG